MNPIDLDINYKLKLISSTDDWVESCQPNPCQYEGKCITSGQKEICQCKGPFTGRFCGLTMCELDPCVFGQCELTSNGFKVSSSEETLFHKAFFFVMTSRIFFFFLSI